MRNDEGSFFAIVCIIANDDSKPERSFRTTLFIFLKLKQRKKQTYVMI
jgi:hypothetical protein